MIELVFTDFTCFVIVAELLLYLFIGSDGRILVYEDGVVEFLVMDYGLGGSFFRWSFARAGSVVCWLD